MTAQRLKEYRQARGWSARELADRCADAGMPGLDRSVLANLESGRRKFITLDEVLTLAWVLGVPAIMLFLPLGTADEFAITPNLAVHPGLAYLWIIGGTYPPSADRKIAGHVDFGTFRKASQPIAMYERLTRAQDALGRAESDALWAADDGQPERVTAAEQRHDEALRDFAQVLDDMVTMGIRPPAVWHTRYDRMRALGLLRHPDAIERWKAEEDTK